MLSFAQIAAECEPAPRAAPSEAPSAVDALVQPEATSVPPIAPKAGLRRKAPPAGAAPAVPAPASPPEPVFVGGKPRSAEFLLDWPVFYDGRTYDAITLRRPTQAEVGAFMDALFEGGSAPFPVFFAPDGAPVPQRVIERLDQDDSDRIMGRLWDFLPVRLQRLAEALSDRPSIPPDGASTAPTSST